jgi:hypothetical protein
MKRAAKLTHHASYQYNINRTMHYKIKFFCNKLKPDSGIEWEMPIAHLIPQMPFATTIGDSLLEDAGGFPSPWDSGGTFVSQTKWFSVHYNDDGMPVAINVLEFVTVIISYCAALHVVWTSPVTDDPHPVILNITNNLLLYLGHSTRASNQKSGKCLLISSVHC